MPQLLKPLLIKTMKKPAMTTWRHSIRRAGSRSPPYRQAIKVSRMPAVTNRTPANSAGGRLATAILVKTKAEPHTRYTGPRHRMSFVEGREFGKRRGAARCPGAENPVAHSQQQHRGDPLCGWQGYTQSQDPWLLADPDTDGNENTDQGLAGNQTRGKQHAVLRELFMVVLLMVLAVIARDQLRDDAAGQYGGGNIQRQIDAHGHRQYRSAPARPAALQEKIKEKN